MKVDVKSKKVKDILAKESSTKSKSRRTTANASMNRKASADRSTNTNRSKDNNKPHSDEHDVFGYVNFMDMFQDIARDISDTPGNNMANIMMNGKNVKAKGWEFKDNLAHSASLARDHVRGIGDLKKVMHDGACHLTELSKNWVHGTTKNWAGFLKDIMKSADHQDKLDSIHGFLMTQMDVNGEMLRERLNNRYLLLSKLFAMQDGHAMGLARNAYNSSTTRKHH